MFVAEAKAECYINLMLTQEELEAAYLKIYLRALKLTPEELKYLKKKGHRYAHLKNEERID